MNVFSKILESEADMANRLGCPLYGDGELIRAQRMFEMTRGNGFRVYASEPAKDSQGLTRGDRKRAARIIANAKEIDRQIKERDRRVSLGLTKAEASQGLGSLA